MKIIIGLGNPGEKYKYTRHNIGFLIIDKIKEMYNFGDFRQNIRFKANVSEGKIDGQKAILIKPITFMNLSGDAVQKIYQFYKVDTEDIVIIYDDISMEFGKTRYRQKGSHGGQNGIRDILQKIGDGFGRIKIGVGQDKRYELSDWVLSKFKEEELIDIDNKIYKKVEQLLIENNFIGTKTST